MRFDAFSKYHPLTNFLFFLGAIGLGVVIQHPAYLAVSLVSAGIYHMMLSGGRGWKLLLAMVPVVVLSALVNPVFNTAGDTPMWLFLGQPYTLEALLYGLVVGGMLAAAILWFSCYSAVLTSDKFTCLFGSLMPALSLLLVMVLRLVPGLARKAKQLSTARDGIGKGVGGQAGRREAVTGSMLLVSALTDWALEGSIVTADSMRSRGYGAAKRTSFQIYRFTTGDWLLMAAMAVLVGMVILFGGTDASFTPTLILATPTLGLAAYAAFLLIPPALYLQEALLWHISISKI